MLPKLLKNIILFLFFFFFEKTMLESNVFENSIMGRNRPDEHYIRRKKNLHTDKDLLMV